MGTIERFEVRINTLNRNRLIRVCLPTNYNVNNERYDVLYMHDGNNLFDAESAYLGVTWDIKKSLEAIEEKYGKSLIIVGIDNGGYERLAEYSPWVNNEVSNIIDLKEVTKYGGEGGYYIDWVVTTLIPLINKKFRTTSTNYMAGSSMGGLISLYGGYKYNNHFKKIGAFSPSIWFAKNDLLKFINDNYIDKLGVYLDIGGKELKKGQDKVNNDVYELYNILKNKGTRKPKFKFDPNGAHNEKAWAKRFPYFAKWLLDISS